MTTATRFFLFFFSLLPFASIAQDSIQPVKWQITSKKTGEGKFELSLKGTIEGNWQVYAPEQILLDVKTTEIQFADSAIVQDGSFNSATAPKQINSVIFENTTVKVFESTVDWKVNIRINGTVPAKLQGTLFYTYGRNDEFYPSTTVPFVTPLEGGVEAARIKVSSIDINQPVSACGDEGTNDKSLLKIFLLGLLGGLIALLTPCVFPMIPVTVTFFTSKSEDKKKEGGAMRFYMEYLFFSFIF